MRWCWNERVRLAAAWCIAAVSGCGPGAVAPPAGHTQQIVLDGSRLPGLSAASIARVDLTISGPGIAQPITAQLGKGPGSSWTGAVTGIPAGPARLFEASAFDAAGTLVYQGQTVSDVTAGATLELVLVLQDPPPVTDVVVPQISSLQISSGQVAPSASVTLTVVASGATPADVLSFGWDSSCQGTSEKGSFGAPTASTTAWQAPAFQPTTCTLSLRVSSQQGSSVTVYFAVQVTN